MLKQIYHVGLTVKDIDKSLEFYRDILGLSFVGELLMEGKETDLLFNKDGCKARVAYLNGSDSIDMPPVELIQFLDESSISIDKPNLFKTSISELCFYVENIDKFYNHLIENDVECLSEPQYFDFSKYGFGKSKAIYFKDPDGIILEAIQAL